MNTAVAEHTCEVCQTVLRYHGGPHPPRWCARHRAQGEREARNIRQRRYMSRQATGPCGRACRGCGSPLLRPDDYCGFCLVELGLREPL